MSFNKWLGLQLFADGGDGGNGGSDGAGAGTGETGVTPADDGQAKLRALGVPEAGIQRWAKRQKNTAKAVATAQTVSPAAPAATEQTPAQESPAEGQAQEETKPKYDWEEIRKDPEISRQISDMMRKRISDEQTKAKAAEDKLAQLTPALEDLSVFLGLDPNNLDIAAIAKAANEKGQMFYESKAYELGTNSDTARKIVKAEIQQSKDAEQKRQSAESERQRAEQQAFEEHIQELMRQGEELKKTFPEFDFNAEMQNPQFRKLTAPGSFSVEDAYRFLHRKEIESRAAEVIARQQAQKIANNIRAGQQRPVENGTQAQAPSVSTFDYSKASPEQRKAFKAYLAREQAAGRKVYPGQYKPPN